jgi:15-cis-phytoene desaturase
LCRRGPRFGHADRGLGDVFAGAAMAYIQRAGGVVQLGTEVSRISRDAAGRHTVHVEAGKVLSARSLVAALPAGALDQVLDRASRVSDPALFKLDRFEAVPYVSVFLWFDRKLTDRRLWARAFRAADFGSDFYDLSNVYRGSAGNPSLIAANIIWSHRVHELDDDQIAEGIRRELAEFLPEADAARVVRRAVHRIPLAVHCPGPGTERLRPETSAARDGLVLAGDWTRTGLPASMESACRSGWLAAERVLDRIGKPRSLAHPPPAPDLGPMLYARTVRRLPFRPSDLLLDGVNVPPLWRRSSKHAI